MIFDSLIITDDEAVEAGLTHKAKLYGVSVFIKNPYSGEIGVSCRFQPFMFWTAFVDFLMDICLFFVSRDKEFQLPLKDIKRIQL